jgi:hypothetical protein
LSCYILSSGAYSLVIGAFRPDLKIKDNIAGKNPDNYLKYIAGQIDSS